jgi:CRISPR/Cas system-associated endoribonuclease Cas2
MRYLLIFDMKGNGAGRKRLSRHLRRAARRVQHSVWEFNNLSDLERAAKLVQSEGGKSMAFSHGDEILLYKSRVRRLLKGRFGN